MSKEFITLGINKSDCALAARQERQLSYFTKSDLQEDRLSTEYLSQWADRKYQTNDYFLNFVKSVFKTDNFLAFFKYLRKPLPSTKLINNKIRPQLNRVFISENADFKYDVTNIDDNEISEVLGNKEFQEELLENYLFKHNAILIADLDKDTPNTPYRFFLDIDKVISLSHNDKRITKIAYNAVIDGESRIIYIDDFEYVIYDTSYEFISSVPHDLGICPADFISKKKYKGNFVVRESIFTYIREELEEYVFLKTLQKMTEPNGAIPVVTKIEVPNNDDGHGGEPSINDVMGSQRATINGDNFNIGSGDLETGTIHEIPVSSILKDDNSLDMDAVKHFLNFFYVPTEALNYIKTRINEVENSIISTVIGQIDTSNEESKNEMQIEKSVIVLENTLITLSDDLSHIRGYSDYKMLALKYGKERVNEVFIFYGTDFFLESESQLFKNLETAPNPIERKNILVRINKNKYKNNQDKIFRQTLLYSLLPYATDKDFEVARSMEIDPIIFQYQVRFNYWIGVFESQFGDIVSFYNGLESDKATRLFVINNLILEIISKNINE